MDFENSSYFGKKYAMNVKVSMLDDIKKLKEKGLITNACLIYSMWHGYIEKENKLGNFIDEIKSMGIDFKELHTSGHADKKTLSLLASLKAKRVIPIHTTKKEELSNILNNVYLLDENEILDI